MLDLYKDRFGYIMLDLKKVRFSYHYVGFKYG
jgi:hypothetical protein